MELWADGYRDPEVAHRQVSLFIANVATKNAWPAGRVSELQARVDAALRHADEVGSGPFGYGIDLRTFWIDVGRIAQDGGFSDLPGWSKVATVLVEGAAVVDAENAFRWRTSVVGGVVGGTAAAATAVADTATDAAVTVGEVAEKATKVPAWVYGAAALALVLVLARVR